MSFFRGYKARRSLERARPPTRREIVAAVPEGSVRLTGPRAGRRWMDALAFCPQLQGMRADGRETHLAFARELAARVSWRDGTTWHSREARCTSAGRGETAWKVTRRHLEQWGTGWIGTVRPGRVYYLEGTGETRHDAAVYVLCIPRNVIRKIAAWRRRRWPWLKTRPPTVQPDVCTTSRRAALSAPGKDAGPRSARAHSRSRPRNAELAAGDPAAAAMAALVRQAAGQGITDGWCGWIVRRLVRAGYAEQDLAEALGRLPRWRDWPAEVRMAPPGTRVRLLAAVLGTERHWNPDAAWPVLAPSPSRKAARAARADRVKGARLAAGQRAAAARRAADPAAIGQAFTAAMAAAVQARAAGRGRVPEGSRSP